MVLSLFLVVVDQFHVKSIRSVKTENDAPVGPQWCTRVSRSMVGSG
jgi:hypothetical protein